jgi:hypothetical protein
MPEDAPKEMGPPASYSVSLPASLPAEWGIESTTVLTISLAATTTKPGPRAPEKTEKEKEEEAAAAKAKGKTPAAKKPAPKKPSEPKKKEEPDQTPIDLTIELVDAAGRSAKLPISRFGMARKPLEANIYRRRGRDAQRFTNNYELVPQTFLLPLADFAQQSPDFNPSALATIRLLFDKTPAGTVVIEHIGLTTPSAVVASPARR